MSQAKRALEEQEERERMEGLIEAKFPGECAWCSSKIHPGQLIGHYTDERENEFLWVHEDCIGLNESFHHAMDKDD